MSTTTTTIPESLRAAFEGFDAGDPERDVPASSGHRPGRPAADRTDQFVSQSR